MRKQICANLLAIVASLYGVHLFAQRPLQTPLAPAAPSQTTFVNGGGPKADLDPNAPPDPRLSHSYHEPVQTKSMLQAESPPSLVADAVSQEKSTRYVAQGWARVPGFTAGQYMEHESTHDANNKIRNLHGGMDRGQALWDAERGEAIIIPCPPGLTMDKVARSVDPAQRGMVYQYYMVDSQNNKYDASGKLISEGWNNYPLFPLDELSAYVNGTRNYIQQGNMTQARFSLDRAEELYRYSYCVMGECMQLPNYDMRPITNAIWRMRDRMDALTNQLYTRTVAK